MVHLLSDTSPELTFLECLPGSSTLGTDVEHNMTYITMSIIGHIRQWVLYGNVILQAVCANLAATLLVQPLSIIFGVGNRHLVQFTHKTNRHLVQLTVEVTVEDDITSDILNLYDIIPLKFNIHSH